MGSGITMNFQNAGVPLTILAGNTSALDLTPFACAAACSASFAPKESP